MNPLNALGSNVGPVFSKPGKQVSQSDGTIGWSGANVPAPLFAQPLAGASFASFFAGATSQPAANADPTAQLTALIQQGTSLSTIVDRLSQLLASAVAQKLPSQTSAAAMQGGALAKSIANALAPPGNAPPGTAADQVAALAQRLQQWIATLAGETKGQAGQQNDIAGNILDANSAKEIPAQRKGETTDSTSVDAAALSRALLASVASALAPAPIPTPVLQGIGANAPGNAHPDASAQAAATAPAAAPVATQITMANAPDLLARMLVRAAGVDARVNGTTAVNGALSSGGTDSTPTALLARFASALESESSGSQSNFSQQHGGQSSQDPSQTNSAVAANAPASVPFVVSPDATPVRSSVDPNAVVEQVVKSMMMRTNASGTSEIHLHLSPEHLGDVTMKITVTGSSISANVVAQNGEVRNALLENQQHLVRSLSDAGMTLSGFSVDVSGGDAGRDSQKDRTAGFGRRYVVHELGAANEPESAQLSSLGPSILPNSSLELLNYLA